LCESFNPVIEGLGKNVVYKESHTGNAILNGMRKTDDWEMFILRWKGTYYYEKSENAKTFYIFAVHRIIKGC
jgi:hypothetical protein